MPPGGRVGQETASTAAELLLNLLMGPMLFYLHTRFVLEILSGGCVTWKNQSRNPCDKLSWRAAARVFWLPSVLSLLGLAAAWRVGFPLAVFILPVTVSWLLSIPLAVVTSDPALGTWLAEKGLFPSALREGELHELGPLAGPGVTPWSTAGNAPEKQDRSAAEAEHTRFVVQRQYLRGQGLSHR